MDVFFKWVGIITVMYFIGRLIHFILERLGVNPDITWKELFQSFRK